MSLQELADWYQAMTGSRDTYALSVSLPVPSRETVVDKARSLVGIRYRHQGRNRFGLDCIGVPGLIGLELGFQSAREWMRDESCKGYGREPNEAMLISACNRHLKLADEALPGDIYLMAWEGRPRHFGVLVEPGRIVHAYADMRKVCETPIDGEWRNGVTWESLIVSAWRYKEID